MFGGDRRVKKGICSEVEERLWSLFKAELGARRIRITTGLEQGIVLALRELGVKVDPAWLEDNDADGRRSPKRVMEKA